MITDITASVHECITRTALAPQQCGNDFWVKCFKTHKNNQKQSDYKGIQTVVMVTRLSLLIINACVCVCIVCVEHCILLRTCIWAPIKRALHLLHVKSDATAEVSSHSKPYCFHTFPIECSNKRAPTRQTIRVQSWANLEIFSFLYIWFCSILCFSHSLFRFCSSVFVPHFRSLVTSSSLFLRPLTLHCRNIYVITFELLNIFHEEIVHLVSCWISI